MELRTTYGNASDFVLPSSLMSDLLGFYPTEVLHHVASWLMTIVFFLSATSLWASYTNRKDNSCPLPLPPGTMGYPFIGETMNWILEGMSYYRKRRESFGPIYKTHLLGRPTIRVYGAQNVRKILHGEHTLVTTSWPTSTRKILGEAALSLSVGVSHRQRKRVVLRAFSQECLTADVRPIQDIVQETLAGWCRQGNIMGYPECRSLTFTITAKILLGFQFSEKARLELLATFYEMENNLFSLPINFPGTGLNKGIRARDKIFEQLGELIKTKRLHPENGMDLFSMILASKPEDGEAPMTEQEMKEVALELIFAGHGTTASAASTALLYLAKKPEVVERSCQELHQHGLLGENAVMDLDFQAIQKLKYTGNVVKELLRILPPIGGGFRKALSTFEIGGYQIPKGWSIAYGIRDTHETAEAFHDVDSFDPDRWASLDEGSTRYQYVPFGGGSRACVGKEFAKLFLKVFLIELVRTCSWRLRFKEAETALFPVPHQKDNLPLFFREVSAFRRRAFSL